MASGNSACVIQTVHLGQLLVLPTDILWDVSQALCYGCAVTGVLLYSSAWDTRNQLFLCTYFGFQI